MRLESLTKDTNWREFVQVISAVRIISSMSRYIFPETQKQMRRCGIIWGCFGDHHETAVASS